MLDFLAYLIGAKIGEKAAPVAMEGGSILLKVFKVLLSVWVWTFFCEAIGDVSIGLKVIDIIVALALVAYFLYCIYKIETKRVRRSKLFSVVCFLVVILTCGINIYLKSGIDIGWIILIALGGYMSTWLPKMILVQVERLGKKSALISDIEFKINQYKAEKKKK